MKKLIEYGRDHHPEDPDSDKSQTAWAVAIMDDCPDCNDIRVELTVEEVGRPGYGQTAHLSAAGARQLRAALGRALKDLGESE
ncbi:MAG TPA: hypothetical protein VG435_02540 [Acidimicrobiales bacterium]|jgi:hypothetical protein|nr:hypothetical protein [Acidimicrobiales bacterium]